MAKRPLHFGFHRTVRVGFGLHTFFVHALVVAHAAFVHTVHVAHAVGGRVHGTAGGAIAHRTIVHGAASGAATHGASLRGGSSGRRSLSEGGARTKSKSGG